MDILRTESDLESGFVFFLHYATYIYAKGSGQSCRKLCSLILAVLSPQPVLQTAITELDMSTWVHGKTQGWLTFPLPCSQVRPVRCILRNTNV